MQGRYWHSLNQEDNAGRNSVNWRIWQIKLFKEQLKVVTSSIVLGRLFRKKNMYLRRLNNFLFKTEKQHVLLREFSSTQRWIYTVNEVTVTDLPNYRQKQTTRLNQLVQLASFRENSNFKPIPVTARSKGWVCSRSPTGTAVSNPAGGMDICLFWVLRAVSPF